MSRGLFTHPRATEFLSRRPQLTVEAIGDDVWTIAHDRARTVFARGSEGLLAVDTLGSPGAAGAYREVLHAKLPGVPIRWLVYSNDHLIRSGYGIELAADAEVIAHAATARVIVGRGAAGQMPVTRTVSAGTTTLDLGGQTTELVYAGPIQGTGTLAVRFPGAGVLYCVGPLPNARYGLLPDYHVGHYADSVRALLALEWDVFVPGRYDVMTRADLVRGLTYFEELQIISQKAFADGIEIWDIRAMEKYARETLQGSFGDLDGWYDHVGITAFRIVHHYLMGGWGLEDSTRPELAYLP